MSSSSRMKTRLGVALVILGVATAAAGMMPVTAQPTMSGWTGPFTLRTNDAPPLIEGDVVWGLFDNLSNPSRLWKLDTGAGSGTPPAGEITWWEPSRLDTLHSPRGIVGSAAAGFWTGSANGRVNLLKVSGSSVTVTGWQVNPGFGAVTVHALEGTNAAGNTEIWYFTELSGGSHTCRLTVDSVLDDAVYDCWDTGFPYDVVFHDSAAWVRLGGEIGRLTPSADTNPDSSPATPPSADLTTWDAGLLGVEASQNMDVVTEGGDNVVWTVKANSDEIVELNTSSNQLTTYTCPPGCRINMLDHDSGKVWFTEGLGTFPSENNRRYLGALTPSSTPQWTEYLAPGCSPRHPRAWFLQPSGADIWVTHGTSGDLSVGGCQAAHQVVTKFTPGS